MAAAVSSVLANTRLAVYRGVTENDLGDEVDDNVTPLVRYTDWLEQRRNLAPNPRAVAGGASFGPDHLGVTSFVEDFPGVVLTAVRWTRTDAGAARARPIRLGAAMPANGVLIGVRMLVRASDACTLSPSARPNTTSSTGAANLGGTIAVPAGDSEITFGGASFVGVAGASSGIVLVAAAGSVPIGGWFDVTAVDLELGGIPASSIDGWTLSDGDTERTRWAGAANGSASILETRTLLGDYGNLPASVIERTKRVQDPASGIWRSIPYLKARMVNPSLDIRKGDRVRDLRTGKLMTVDSITRTSRSLAAAASLTLDLTDRANS